MSREKTFTLYGRTITIPSNYTVYIEIVDGYNPATGKRENLGKHKFYWADARDLALVNYNDAEGYVLCGKKDLEESMLMVAKEAVALLRRHGREEFTAQSYLDSMDASLTEDWDTLFAEFSHAHGEMAFDQIMKTERAKIQMSRGQRSYGQTLGAVAKSEIGGEWAQIKLSEKYRKRFAGCIENIMKRISFHTLTILDAPFPSQNDDVAACDNLSVDEALDLLEKNPYQKPVYIHLLREYGDESGELTSLANFFGLDTSAIKKAMLDEFADSVVEDSVENLDKKKEQLQELLVKINIGSEPEESQKKLEVTVKTISGRIERFRGNAEKEERTFQGKVYDTVEEKQKIENQYNKYYGHIEDYIGKAEDKIRTLDYILDQEHYEKANEIHDAVEQEYAGLVRSRTMMELKQYLYVCKKMSENSTIQKARILALAAIPAINALGFVIANNRGIIARLLITLIAIFLCICMSTVFDYHQISKAAQKYWNKGQKFEFDENASFRGKHIGDIDFSRIKTMGMHSTFSDVVTLASFALPIICCLILT